MLKLLPIVLIFLFFIPSIVRADIPNPDFLNAQCPNGEQLIECDTGFRLNPNASRLPNQCLFYENNPSYQSLSVQSQWGGTVDQDHGQRKYCYHPASSLEGLTYHGKRLLLLLAVTILLELPIYYRFGFKSKNNLLQVILANLISLPTFYLISLVSPIHSFVVLLALEIAVIFFEAMFLYNLNKVLGLKKVLLSAIVANAFSAIVGSFIVSIINSIIRGY